MTGNKNIDIYDPLGLEIFAIDESFESLFNALKGVYFRLYYKELKLTGKVHRTEKENSYLKRFSELGTLKRSFEHNDWISKKRAVEFYSKEFKEMILIEFTAYAPFGS